ncbi:MAG TPA: hypothetical protein PLV68_19105, partial [Ilumatobacteraceae bacterium]|nr:hypothetical protein [Ilumatobacteraceae bacterium]
MPIFNFRNIGPAFVVCDPCRGLYRQRVVALERFVSLRSARGDRLESLKSRAVVPMRWRALATIRAPAMSGD